MLDIVLSKADKAAQLTQSIFEKNPSVRFWSWQIVFWIFMCVVGFLTLVLWYSEFTPNYILHTSAQAILGLLYSLLLHKIFVYLGKLSLGIRNTLGLVSVLVMALVWTLSHMYVFAYLTGFDAIWQEFGGWYFSGIFIFLCWAALFHGVRYYELMQHEHKIALQAVAKSEEENLKRVQAQSEARDAKLKMLRYQLNPHFLCNTLNAINSLIECDEAYKAQDMSIKLSEFLRYSLDNDPDVKVPLNEEVDALNLYLDIERIRFADRLKINIDIRPSAQDALVPSLLLQPVIENSMKHAIAKCEEGGEISIYADVIENKLVLKLTDTGCPESKRIEPHHESNGGVGTKNIHQRLKALYNDAFELSCRRSDQGGLTTVIEIPYEIIPKTQVKAQYTNE